MIRKEYISLEKAKKQNYAKLKLKNNFIIKIKTVEELKEAIRLSKKLPSNLKAIQTTAKIINYLHKEDYTDFKKQFKYISIIQNNELIQKLSNQNNFVECIIDFENFSENKDMIISKSPNRIILTFNKENYKDSNEENNIENNKDNKRSKDNNNKYSKEEIIDILNEILLAKIFPLTKGLEINDTLPEHMYELFNKDLTLEEIEKSKLSKSEKDEIIKFLNKSGGNNQNERIINRI